MNVATQGLAHFSSTHIGNGVQCETIVQLVVIEEVLPNAVDNKMEEVMLLVEKQGNSEIADLFFRVF